MKKIFYTFLICIMCLGLTGCNNSELEDLKNENEVLKKQVEQLSGNNVDDDINEAKSNNIKDIEPIGIVSMEQGKTEYGFVSSYFTVQNNTNDIIHTISLTISMLDENGNIIDSTYPQESVNVNPGQSIKIECMHETGIGVKKLQVDSYSYYIYHDNAQNEYEDYKQGKLRSVVLDIVE